MKKKTIELADRISYRLLATNKHPDYEWLCNELDKKPITFKSIIKSYLSLLLDGYRHHKIRK